MKQLIAQQQSVETLLTVSKSVKTVVSFTVLLLLFWRGGGWFCVTFD